MSLLNPNNWFNDKNTHSSTRSQRQFPQNNNGNYDNNNGYYHNHAPDANQHSRSYRSTRGCGPITTVVDQSQMTADMQMFKEQVNDIFVSVEQAARMSQDPQWDESIVNAATDGAVLTLDMFAVSCGEFCKNKDKDALDLAKKTVYDKWNALKLKDEQTYRLTTNYRDFLIAALNGNQNLRYKSYRVASSELDKQAESELANNPRALHDATQHLITNQQRYNAKQKKNRNTPSITSKYTKQHDEELKHFRGGKKYRNQETLHTQNGHYQKPKQNDFYFTKSGKNASFEGLNAKSKKQEEQDAMERDICGGAIGGGAYDKIPNKLAYPNNARLLLSKKNPLGKRVKPIPCRVLYPQQNGKKVFKHIVVKPAFPFNDATMRYAPHMLCFDVTKVRSLENKHIRKHGELGYESITDIDDRLNAVHGAMDVDSN